MICLVFFISVNDYSAFTQSKNFQIVGFEHPNIELKPQQYLSSVARGFGYVPTTEP